MEGPASKGPLAKGPASKVPAIGEEPSLVGLVALDLSKGSSFVSRCMNMKLPKTTHTERDSDQCSLKKILYILEVLHPNIPAGSSRPGI